MSEVYLFKYGYGRDPLQGLEKLLSWVGFDAFIPQNGKIAVKLHMGERGNIRYLRPVFARKVVDLLRGKKGEPFLFDTVANYPGSRSTPQKYLKTAAMNGFVEATVNAPIVVTSDSDALTTVSLPETVDGCELKEVKIPTVLLESQAIIVLSHVKGHEFTGFGGAIKHLGMGCVANETKQAQHKVNEPVLVEENCNACGNCVEQCPAGVIQLVSGKARKQGGDCIYCSTCFFVCLQDCWVLPPRAKENLQIYVAHAASAVYRGYKQKMVFFNFIQDVVPGCDCMPGSGEPLVRDVGIACSFDPVALDQASLRLVDESPRMPEVDVPGATDILGKIHETDCMVQILTAEKLGMGTSTYDLIEV